MTMNHQSSEPRAWLVRGSKDERFDPWMLENGYTGVGFREIPRLDQAADLPAMKQLIQANMPDEKAGAVGNYAAQLNAFANKITAGDIVVLPLKKEGLLAFGTVTGDYEYLTDSDGLKHVRKVNWDRIDVNRASINQDLLYSLGAFSTVCEIKRNDAAYRLGRVRAALRLIPVRALTCRSYYPRWTQTCLTLTRPSPLTGKISSVTHATASSPESVNSIRVTHCKAWLLRSSVPKA